MAKYARLKPHNGKQHVLKTYTVFGIKFMEQRGWYEVDDDVAAYLRTIKQKQDTPDAQYAADAFDVVDSIEEAKGVDEREKKMAERRAAEHANRVSRPQTTTARRGAPRAQSGDMTTSDLRGEEPVRPKKGDSFDDQPETFPEDGKPLDVRTRPTAPVLVDGADEEEAVTEIDDNSDRVTSPVIEGTDDEVQEVVAEADRKKPKGGKKR